MASPTYTSALIVGAGQGLSASLTRLLRKEGLAVAIAARDTAKLAPLCTETGARAFACDAQDEAQVQRLFADIDREHGAPDVVIYNASARTRGPFLQLVPAEVQRALQVTAFGAFLVAQQAVVRMMPKAHGVILFTGASASVKGYAQSAPFAMGKFALRGASPVNCRRMASTSRTSSLTAGSAAPHAATTRTSQTRCLIPTRSRSPTSIFSASHAAPGPGRSS